MILLLLDLYRTHTTTFYSTKHANTVWQKIADGMKEAGYELTHGTMRCSMTLSAVTASEPSINPTTVEVGAVAVSETATEGPATKTDTTSAAISASETAAEETAQPAASGSWE